MLSGEAPFINEQFYADGVSPGQLDNLLADGWRHFGTQFFRYSFSFYDLDIRQVIPLRIRLSNFSPSKSQRRVLSKNNDLQTMFRPIAITPAAEDLFEIHKARFKSGIPNSIYDFLSTQPESVPCEATETAVFDGVRLLAMSYFDIGKTADSGVYAMFDPEVSMRGLGIFTMLKEIEFAVDTGKQFYYQGYAYKGSSFYDYKKRFRGTESFDWNGKWTTFSTTEE